MKKIIYPISLIATSSLFAASFTDIGGGSALHSVTGGTFESITVNAPSGSDSGYKGNLSTDSSFLIETSYTGQFVAVDTKASHITINSDYEFNSLITTSFTKAGSDGFVNNTVRINNGATVKFNAGLLTNKNTASNSRLTFTGDGFTGYDGYNTTSFTRGYVELTSLSTAATTNQIVTAGVTLTTRVAENVAFASFGYFHVFYDTIVDMQCDLKISTIAARSTILNQSQIGTFYLNGHTLKSDSFTLNNSKHSVGTHDGVITFDMSATEDSAFICGGSIGGANFSYTETRVEFTNADLNDLILFKGDTPVKELALLYINGLTGDDILTEKYMYDGVEYNRYYVIPEPSTYAIIFGALALGFVACRRRK